MPKASQVEYQLRELTELMVRDRGITDGEWMLLVRFKMGAANVGVGADGDISPAAIVGIESIGIQLAKEPNSISVDASKLPSSQKKRSPQRSAAKASAPTARRA
jgi:hypothetical protein